MEIFENSSFYYKSGELYCEDIPVRILAEEFGTPLFIYSRKYFEERLNEFTSAFEQLNHKIFFAVKSNFNINVIKLLNNLGAGADVNSAGELFRAIKAGVNAEDIIFSGVGKTEEEIILALKKKIKLLKAESLQEIFLINDIAASLGVTASIAIRVNPDVDARTHPYISTGLMKNKFGIDWKKAGEVFLKTSRLNNIKICGLDMHIGSQIISVDVYKEAVEKLAEFYYELKREGIAIKHFDVGGGFGVKYKDEKPIDIHDLAGALIPILKELNVEVFFEPGRFITANGGILIGKTLYNKKNGDKNFIILDASITELLRPSLYNAYHHIQPVTLNNRREIIADVVGGVCESGDYLAQDRKLSETEPGEYLAILGAGAYGMTMSSNYNGRRRPPEILVQGNKPVVIRGRETYEHLLFDEEIKI